jgi:hypothetical protein
MIAFGIVKPGSTLRIPFDTFAASTGANATLTNFAVGDILIYKDGNTTPRASTTGFTATTSFASIAGINEAVIDLSSDATADFYKAGSNYVVVINPVTADGQNIGFVAATFTIGYENAVLNTSIATLASQTSFTLTAGPAEDDALNGMWAIVHDKASAVQWTWVQILDYTGSTKTVTLAAVPPATYTIDDIDNFSVMGLAPLQPTVTGTRLDVTAAGNAGIDWGNIENPTTAQNLSATNIDVDQVVASVTGAVGSVTGAVGSVTGNVGGNVVGSVGSVTGNVGGNVTGSVGSVVGNVGGDLVGDVQGNVDGNLGGNVAGDVQGNVDGSVGSVVGLNPALLDVAVSTRATPAQVNAEVLDVLNVDTFAQPGQATPAATTSIRLMLAWLYKAWRNRTTQTASQYSLFNDDASTVDQKATFSDDGTTADRGEVATGP